MGYQYLLLVGHDAPRVWNHCIEASHTELGLRPVSSCDGMILLASQDTPALHLPNGGVILGHLFARDGTAIRDLSTMPVHSDPTRTLAHVLDRFWGEYILVHPDAGSAGFTVLRDPSGGVPCLYSLQEGFGAITSDISLAIRTGLYRKQIDWNFIARRLRFPNLKSHITGLSGVKELLPGSSLAIRCAQIDVEQTWSPWRFVSPGLRHSDPDQAAQGVRNAVTLAVKAWAETDSNVLLELSGGLDSSIVASCLRGSRATVTCCTLATPVAGTDEQQYAKAMADYLGIDLQKIDLDFGDALFEFAPPSSSVVPSMGPLQYAVNTAMEAAGAHLGVTSFFSGAGGDTVFAYLSNASPAVDALLERGLMSAGTAVRDLSFLHQCTIWKAARLAVRKLLRGPKNPTQADGSFLTFNPAADVPEAHPWFAAPSRAYPGDRERIADLAGTQVFRDDAPRSMTRWLRMPLLSQPVIEETLRVPTWMAIAGGRNRSVARAAFAHLLPAEIVARRSKATFLNYLGAFYQRNRWKMRDFLLSGELRHQNLLDTAALDCFLASDLPLHDHSFVRISELCTIENWVRHQH